MYNKLIILALAVICLMVCIVPTESYALCDIANARVVNAETIPFNSSGTTATRFYIAQSAVLPTVYFTFDTSNQMFINHLNAAQAGNLQVRVTGNAAACPTTGTIRFGGLITAVFRSNFF